MKCLPVFIAGAKITNWTNGVSSVGGLSSFRTASLLPAMRKGMLNRNEETYFKRGVGGCDDGLFGRMWFGDTGR